MTSEPASVDRVIRNEPTLNHCRYSCGFASIRGLNTSPPPRTSFVVEPENVRRDRGIRLSIGRHFCPPTPTGREEGRKEGRKEGRNSVPRNPVRARFVPCGTRAPDCSGEEPAEFSGFNGAETKSCSLYRQHGRNYHLGNHEEQP